MLVIKRAQLESFIAEDDTHLVRVIREIIRESSHEEVACHSDETLDGMVRIGIEQARSRDFERIEDVTAFVALMFEISPSFDVAEQFDLFFKDKTLPTEFKIEQLLGRMTDEQWHEAEETYDARGWFPERSQKSE